MLMHTFNALTFHRDQIIIFLPKYDKLHYCQIIIISLIEYFVFLWEQCCQRFEDMQSIR